jgi:hypothetical protein
MRTIVCMPREPDIHVADAVTEILQVILCKGLFKNSISKQIHHNIFLKTNEGIFSMHPFTDFKQAWTIAKSLAKDGFPDTDEYWSGSRENFFLDTEYNLNFYMFDYPQHRGYTPVNMIFDRAK